MGNIVLYVCYFPIRILWFSLGTPVSFTNEIDRHDITEILLKVALIINSNPNQFKFYLHAEHVQLQVPIKVEIIGQKGEKFLLH